MSTVTPNDLVRRAKVVPPRLPSRLLVRPQLVRELQQALSVKVTLVIAGAGYGKTIAIAQALEELQGKRGGPTVAWLQLDEYDVDRVAFFNALVASVEQAVPGFFKKWRSQLAVMSANDFAQRFSDELSAVNREVVLVIEDIHWLIRGEKEAYTALSPIVELLPNNAHCILTSRKVLLMESAARMRARQQLMILGKEKLTLTVEEVRRLLHEVYQEDVPDELVRRIAEQVEGWVTGVVLLLQARYVLEIQAWDSFIGLISGESHEFFFAYFMSEVYERLSENMRRCLRLLADLPEWDVKVVQKVYGDDVTRELARYVSDENALFVHPVDERRTRFRFHPMFREFLRAQGPLQESLVRQLAEHEYKLGNHRIAAKLFKQSGAWEQMLESMYQLLLVARREAVAPQEVREMLEAVPADIRHTFQAWWVMRAAQLIFAGEMSEVSKLPCQYKKFKEPYKTKFLGLLSLSLRNEGRPREVLALLASSTAKYLKQPEKVYPQEIVALVVTYALSLIDLHETKKARPSVDWLEQRKLIAPESEDDDLVLWVLRA